MCAGNANARMLKAFNRDKSVNVFVCKQKRTKAYRNVYCALQPQNTIIEMLKKNQYLYGNEISIILRKPNKNDLIRYECKSTGTNAKAQSKQN